LAIVVPSHPGSKFLCEKLGKAGRKKKEQGKKEEERWYPNSRARLPRSGDCDSAWTSSLRKGRTEVDYQVAAPTESSTPNLHRAKIAQQECGWKGGDTGGSAQWEQSAKRRNKEEEERKKREKSLTLTGLLIGVDCCLETPEPYVRSTPKRNGAS
jgi:hypothetical protein